jgi:hypothetical protein
MAGLNDMQVCEELAEAQRKLLQRWEGPAYTSRRRPKRAKK